MSRLSLVLVAAFAVALPAHAGDAPPPGGVTQGEVTGTEWTDAHPTAGKDLAYFVYPVDRSGPGNSGSLFLPAEGDGRTPVKNPGWALGFLPAMVLLAGWTRYRRY